MSRQINFYAAPADTDRIHQWLLTEFPGLTLVSPRRGPKAHTEPMDASTPGAFWHYPISALVPVWAKPLLVVEDLSPDYPDEFVIRPRDNPVIEYGPCHWDESTKTVTRSRFYWAYSGELPADCLRQVNKLFRWVQQNTIEIKGPFWRFFPVAAETAQFTRQHITESPRANPLFGESRTKQTNREQVG